MSADRPDNGADTSWLTLDEAGQRLGLSKDALRKRIDRGRIEARLGNDGTTRVLVTSATPPGPGLDGAGQVQDSPELVRIAVQLDDTRPWCTDQRGRRTDPQPGPGPGSTDADG